LRQAQLSELPPGSPEISAEPLVEAQLRYQRMSFWKRRTENPEGQTAS